MSGIDFSLNKEDDHKIILKILSYPLTNDVYSIPGQPIHCGHVLSGAARVA